jgi:transposase
MLIPNVRKTWAPVGETPLLRHHYQRHRISTITALTVSPHRQRLGLWVQFHRTNITGVEVRDFLRYLLRPRRGPVVLLWDGGTIHRRVLVRDFLECPTRLHVYPFPAYDPELHPAEFVWTHTQGRLSNGAPDDLPELHTQLRRSFARIKNSQRLLHSCFRASDLSWP